MSEGAFGRGKAAPVFGPVERIDAQAIPDASGWEPPVLFSELDLPAFPCEALSPTLKDFVRAEAVATQTPPDAASLLALTTCAAAVSKRAIVRVKEGYFEPLNLFSAVVQAPGERKSQVFKDVTAPLIAYEQAETKRLAPQILAEEQRRRIVEKRLATAEANAARAANPAERERAELEAHDLAERLDSLRVPGVPRILVDDATPEALASLLAQHAGRLAVMSPEGGVFEILAGRYSELPNLDVYLKGHAGDDLRIDRRTRPTEWIPKPALSVGLAIQPGILKRFSERPIFRQAGLLARFLYALPESRLGSRDVDPPSLPSDTRQRYEALVAALLALPARDEPEALRLSPDAFAAWRAFAEELEPQLAEFAELGPIQDWAAKLSGAVVRLAGVLALEEWLSDPTRHFEISGEIYQHAVAIGRYLIPHAIAAFAAMGAEGPVDDAKTILRCMGRKGWTRFSRRELHQVLRGRERFKDPETLDRPLEILVQRHFLRLHTDKRRGPGRRPSATFLVNPRYRPAPAPADVRAGA